MPVSTKKIEPIIIPRNAHSLSRKQIHPNALKVLYRLHGAGFSAYLVGGCVRDLLLGYHPKDFDVATNAHPEEVRHLFKNCRLIGKRFRLAHVFFGPQIIEVATFRTHHENATHEHHAKSHEGMIIRDNVYGEIEDDAWRRDFSVNALYYNIADFSLVDYTGGLHDIETRLLRVLGDPKKRFLEDPVRLLRAVRFMGKLNLSVDAETESAMHELHHLVKQVSSARLFQEVLKFFQEGSTLATFKLMQKYQLISALFPLTEEMLNHPTAKKLIEITLADTDTRFKENKTVSPAFLFAIFLWHPIVEKTREFQQNGAAPLPAVDQAIHFVFKLQSAQLAIPRRLLMSIRDICFLQHRFIERYGMRPFRLLNHPRFRAAYDLLMMRKESGEPIQDLVNWWIEFYASDHAQQEKMLKQIPSRSPRKKSRKRHHRKKMQAPMPPL